MRADKQLVEDALFSSVPPANKDNFVATKITATDKTLQKARDTIVNFLRELPQEMMVMDIIEALEGEDE